MKKGRRRGRLKENDKEQPGKKESKYMEEIKEEEKIMEERIRVEREGI